VGRLWGIVGVRIKGWGSVGQMQKKEKGGRREGNRDMEVEVVLVVECGERQFVWGDVMLSVELVDSSPGLRGRWGSC
jgi:hypothetical protein